MEYQFIFAVFVVILSYSNGRNIENVDKLVEQSNYEVMKHDRVRRYLGNNRKYKLNMRYQECIGPGDSQGHCKYLQFCPMDVLGNSRFALDFLCVINKTDVGVCCPDDIIRSGLVGSQLILDLPASGADYEVDDNTTGCGIPLDQKDIGRDNFQQKWPWIVGLYRPREANFFCGGTLITENHVLTAAHCAHRQTEIVVRLGEYDFARPDETRFLDVNASKIIIHEDFNLQTYDNDISILVLQKPTTFNSYIWPICLPPVGLNFDNDVVYTAGWGQTAYNGSTSHILLQVSFPVWPKDKCQEAFTQVISDAILCAGASEGGKDSCKGDSGGPLLYQLENRRWVIAGVVSWGIRCGEKGRPGIYTRVNEYIGWIIKNTIAI